MDDDQKFILEKIKYGLAKKGEPEPMSKVDFERLNWPADDYTKLPEAEWNEWSRKTHWALQVAFAHDTSRLQDKDKINKWRNKCINVVQNAFAKDPSDRIVLESATLHFVENDLLHHVIDVFGYKNLNEEEEKLVEMFAGAAKLSGRKVFWGIVLSAIALIVILVILIFFVF